MMLRPGAGPAPVRPAAASETPALAGVLARAFAADPIVRWPFAARDGQLPEEHLLARIEAMFEIVDRAFAAEGWIHVAAEGLGVMSLLPPGSTAREREIGEAIAPAIGALTADDGARYEQLWAWIDRMIPFEPRWLLDQLAVEPAAQGLGIGGAMLRFAIGCSQHDGLPLVLETAVAGNVALYEHFGFRVALAADAPDGGPHIWFMSRDPGRRSRPARQALPDPGGQARRPRGQVRALALPSCPGDGRHQEESADAPEDREGEDAGRGDLQLP